MASWKEINRFHKDSASMRDLAKRLLSVPNQGFTEWESTFLDSIARNKHVEEFTTRQSQKLLQIRDDTELVREYRTFSIKIMLEKCQLGRLDLSETDEEWIMQFEPETVSLRRRHAARLYQCARELGIVERDDEDRAA